MEDLAQDFKGKAAIGIVDKRERSLFRKFRVRGIPQFYVFRDGKVKEKFIGARAKRILTSALKRHQSARKQE